MLNKEVIQKTKRIKELESANLAQLKKLRKISSPENTDLIEQEIKVSEEIIRYCDVFQALGKEKEEEQRKKLEKMKEIIMIASPAIVTLFMEILKYLLERR